MKIYFVRHGESEANILKEFSNWGDKHPLTEKGRQQAEVLAQNLEELPLKKIFTSPIKRARETAEILSTALNIPAEVTEALREGDVGALEGRADPASWAIYQQVQNAWWEGDFDISTKDGESFTAMQARFMPFIEKLIAADSGDVVLIGHGALYRFMLPELLINIDAEWAYPHAIGNTAYILAETDPEGLGCVEWCGVKPAV
jgi:2,3-bisphosphoglycerate-dependent phosphoglycerate mutase